jgi:hypothetical protein
MIMEINIMAGLVAGVAAMVPGAIIYSPSVLGKAWMKETGHKPGGSPTAAVTKMFVTSLINGLFASLIVWTAGANTFAEAVRFTMVSVGWFWVSSSLMLVYFEGRSWKWFKISATSHIFTAAVIGIVLGLFV